MKFDKTRLLVSVRDAEEAQAALVGGADVIDVKEPYAGALGAADPAVLRQVVDEVGGRVPVSAALGELQDWHPRKLENFPSGIAWAKLGLAAMAARADWPCAWQAALAALPPGTRPVAVLYADGPSAAAPPPEQILAHGVRLGCTAVLIDTFDKTAGDLLHHVSLEQLADLIARVHRFGLPLAVAGSLRQPAIERIVPLGPDLIAVRTAACTGGRLGRVATNRVAALVQSIDGANAFRRREPARP